MNKMLLRIRIMRIIYTKAHITFAQACQLILSVLQQMVLAPCQLSVRRDHVYCELVGRTCHFRLHCSFVQVDRPS